MLDVLLESIRRRGRCVALCCSRSVGRSFAYLAPPRAESSNAGRRGPEPGLGRPDDDARRCDVTMDCRRLSVLMLRSSYRISAVCARTSPLRRRGSTGIAGPRPTGPHTASRPRRFNEPRGPFPFSFFRSSSVVSRRASRAGLPDCVRSPRTLDVTRTMKSCAACW
jgi:hypothetical protein